MQARVLSMCYVKTGLGISGDAQLRQVRSATQFLSADRRIYAIREQLPGSLVSRWGAVDWHVRVRVECQRLLLLAVPVKVTPVPSAFRHDQQVQTSAKGNLPWRAPPAEPQSARICCENSAH